MKSVCARGVSVKLGKVQALDDVQLELSAGAAQALLKEGWSFEGKRVLVAGTGPLLFAVAGNLAKVGAKIVAIVEQAPMKSVLRFAMGTLKYQPLKLLDAVKYGRHYFPAPYIKGSWIRKVNDNSEGKGAVLSNDKVITCDVVACGFGLFPNGELAELAAKQDVPEAEDIKLKDPKDFVFIGKYVPRKDKRFKTQYVRKSKLDEYFQQT